MTQQIKINKDDLQDLIIFAQRYTIGRMTYAPSLFKNIVLKHLSDLEDSVIQIIITDIEQERNRDNLGMECDKVIWLSLLETLKSELKKREMK